MTCLFWTSKEIILARGMKQCWFTIHILFCSSVDLRFCLLTVPKNLELIWLSSHLSCSQYSMHVFVTYLGNIGPPFRNRLLRALVSICLSDLFSWIGICSTRYNSYPFMLGEEVSSFLWGPFLLHWVLLFIIILKGKLERFWFCSWKLKLSMQLAILIKDVFRSFYDDTLWALVLYGPYMHVLPPA